MNYKFFPTYTLLLVIFNIGLISVKSSDMFSALIELKKALHAEGFVAQNLRKYLEQELHRIKILEGIAKDLEDHSSKALDDPMIYLSNPVNAYKVIKRFAVDWNGIVEKYIKPHLSQAFLSSLSQMTTNFPDSEDLKGSALALLRLQDVYDLSTDQMSTGKIKGVAKSPDMTADDCFQLGLVAYNREDWYHAVLWMSTALKIDLKEIIKTSSRTTIIDYLSYATYRQGNIYQAYNLTAEWLTLDPLHTRALGNLNHFAQLIEEQKEPFVPTNDRILNDYKKSPDYKDYEKLCRGEKTHEYKLERFLSCQYKRHKPMFYIKPVKEEIAYFEPLIVLYRNVLSENEMAKVKEISTPMLHRSGVFKVGENEVDESYPEYRTSKTAWLSDTEDNLIERIGKKASGLSNLTLDTVEFLQVLNYGIGGQYEPHYDFARPNEISSFEDWRGNRIATVICYISVVEAGGGTVFNEIGVSLPAEKGACVIWYNLLKNGQGDYKTRHAGCPVLSGTKWVCNKWFHIKGQEFSRPCSLSPNE